MYHLYVHGSSDSVSAAMATNRRESKEFYAAGTTSIIIKINVVELNKMFNLPNGIFLMVSGNLVEHVVLLEDVKREFVNGIIGIVLQLSTIQENEEFYELPDELPEGIPVIEIS